MNTVITIEEIADWLVETSVFLNTKVNTYAQDTRQRVISAEKVIMGKICRFQISFDEYFPSTLPKFKLENVSTFPVMPHVNAEGVMCLYEEDTILVDPFAGFEIILSASNRAFRIIEDGLATNNKIEVFLELDAFLERIPNASFKSSIVTEKLVPDIIWMTEFNGQSLIGDNKSQIIRYLQNLSQGALVERLKFSKALYVPLNDVEIDYIPPFQWNKWWPLSIIRAFFWKALMNHRAFAQNFIADRSTSKLPVIFKLNLPKDGAIHFGVQFKSTNSGVHPMCKKQRTEGYTPIKINRMDKDFLLPRGGGYKLLFDKNVLLVGCGSVGSYIAHGLTKSGVSKLTLIDHDLLKPENIHRHLLGMSDIIHSRGHDTKSSLLKRKLEADLPNCKINSISDRFEKFLNNHENFEQFDLVILATGNDNLNFLASDLFFKYLPAKPLMFVWLDPLGVGGHVLISNIEPQGCYKCLFENDMRIPDISHLHNKASFAASGQSFTKTLSGCHGRFTEFGLVDVQDTASLATRLAINVLKDKQKFNKLFSWKGDAENFLEQGYKLSKRYKMDSAKLGEGVTFADKFCPICGDEKHRKQIPTLSERIHNYSS